MYVCFVQRCRNKMPLASSCTFTLSIDVQEQGRTLSRPTENTTHINPQSKRYLFLLLKVTKNGVVPGTEIVTKKGVWKLTASHSSTVV